MPDQILRASEIIRRARFSETSASQACLAWSPDGKQLLSGGHDGVVHVLDARTGHCRFEYEAQLRRSPIASLAWSASPTERDFAMTTERDLYVFRRKVVGSPFELANDHVMAGASVFAAPDTSQHPGHQFLVLHEGRLKTYARQASPPGAYDLEAFGQRRPIRDLAWSPGGKRLALVSADGVWAADVPEDVYDERDIRRKITLLGERLRYVSGGETPVLEATDPAPLVAWIDGGRSLVIIDRSGPTLVRHDFGWHVEAYHGTVVTRRDLMSAPLALAGDPAHDRYAIATDARLYVVVTRDGSPTIAFEAALATGERPCLAFSPDGRQLAVTRRVLHEGEDVESEGMPRVTLLELDAPTRVEASEPPDPRYADGSPPAD